MDNAHVRQDSIKTPLLIYAILAIQLAKSAMVLWQLIAQLALLLDLCCRVMENASVQQEHFSIRVLSAVMRVILFVKVVQVLHQVSVLHARII
jgi:hypothetical protein